MARIPSPNWYSPPQLGWLPCEVAGDYEPEGYAVQIHMNGSSVAAIVPYDSVSFEGSPPARGKVKVLILAEINEDEDKVLAELPAEPINGTQRVSVKREWLT